MREITLNGQTLQYKVETEVTEHGDYSWTEFYDGKVEVLRHRFNWKKFRFEPYAKTIWNHVFTIHEDADRPDITKGWWRDRIAEKIELMGRENEIAKGQLI